MKKRVYQYEIYLKSPSGQGAWEIHFVNVFADNEQSADTRLKVYPLFDKILTRKGEVQSTEQDVTEWNKENLFRRVPLTEIENNSLVK